jgi:hypothetical protein
LVTTTVTNGEKVAGTAVGNAPRRRQKLYWVGGSKGGVGKSLVAVATVDHLMERGEKVLLVECDTSNPDVWKMYRNFMPTEVINLDEADGWIHLVNVCDTNPESVVVMNTAARNNDAVTKFADTLDRSLEELGRDLVALWVINRQRDSLELLKEFASAVPKALVHVIRNGHFGDERKFELFNTSQIRRDVVEGRGGKAVTLPDLADRVADDLYTKRLSVAEAARTLPIGNRAELGRWREQVGRVLAEVLG